MINRRAFGLLAAGLTAGLSTLARAQGAFPDHTMRWIVGYPAGGASDTFARLIGQKISASLGQSMVTENRPGGGAVVATDTVVRSPADGYTMLHVDNGILNYNPALYTKLPFDPDKDLTGVGFIGRFPLFLVVRPDSPFNTLADYITASKRNAPTYGTPAVASPHHLAMELLKRRANFDATHVPYRGGPAAMQDLLSGAVDSVVIDCATGIPFIRENKVKTLVVLSDTRSASAPQVPTTAEAGVANAVAYGWQGMSVPHGTPAPIIAKLNEALNAAVATDDIQGRMKTLGIESAPWTPAQFNDFVAKENGVWRPLIRELGIKLDS